jgi:hypothetical protein
MCIYAHVCKSGIIMNRALDPRHVCIRKHLLQVWTTNSSKIQ